MKKFNKVTAALTAAIMMMGTFGTVAVNAADASVENAQAEAQLAQIMEQAEQIKAVQQEASSDFVPYDQYIKDDYCSTPRYFGVLANKGARLRSASTEFYVNANILPTNNYSSISRFRLGPAFKDNSSIKSVSVTNVQSNVKSFKVDLSIPDVTVSKAEVLFTYEMGEIEEELIPSEWDLHIYTSRYEEPSTILGLSNGTPLYKCVYALGDVDRNGKLEPMDELNMLVYVNGTVVSDGSLDAAAFELAADVNFDGKVTVEDVQIVNNVLLNLGTF